MSGGSFDYLCHKDAESDLSALLHGSALRAMSDELAALGYATDAAKETEETLLIIRQMVNRIDARMDRLRGVWKAVEWWRSGDSGEDAVHEALAKYRGNT